MDYTQITDLLSKLTSAFPIANAVLAGLGTLVVVGQVIVLLTPTKKDDEKLEEMKKGFLGVVIAVLSKFAVVQKK